MKTLDNIISEIIAREGGSKYTNHPNDKGGPTKFGVTQGALSRYRGGRVTAQDVQELTENEARALYHQNYVVAPGYNRLNNVKLIEQLIDAGVNHGTAGAVKMLQTALGVTVDGKLGPNTAKAANRFPGDALVICFFAERCRYYAMCLRREKNRVFAGGWFNRMAHMIDEYTETL